MSKLLKKINVDNIVLTIFIFYMAGASTLTQSDIYFTIVFFIAIFYLFFVKKKGLDYYILILFGGILIINILSYFVVDGLNFNGLTFFGVTMRFFFPYLLVKIVGSNFFDKLINYIYFLAVISLILYPIDALFQGLFDSYAPLLNFITQDEQKGLGGWYIFVYMHSAWAYIGGITGSAGLYRNSGFMWEPGAYALMLIFALAYNLSKNKFVFCKKNIVFFIALITTFSTAGYLAFFLISIALLLQLNKRYSFLFFILCPFVIYGIISLYKLDFISKKINNYQESADNHYTHFSGVERVNRFGIMIYNLEQAYHWPFGNGAMESKYLYDKYGVIYSGPNTLAGILYKWGFLGLFLFIFCLFKFFRQYNSSLLITYCFVIAVIFVFFSNPTETKPLYGAIIFYYILNKNKISAKKKLSNG